MENNVLAELKEKKSGVLSNLTKETYMYILGGIIIVGFFTVMVFLAVIDIPTASKDMFYIVLGALVSKFSTVVDYFYGTSKGSSDKNDLLKEKQG